MTKRKIACLCLAVLLLMPMLFTGCGEEGERALAHYTENSLARAGHNVSVQNENFQLAWQDNYQRFRLVDKTTKKSYYSASLDDESVINTPIIVEYYDENKRTTATASLSGAVDCLENGTYSSEKIENGFRVVYSFEEKRIAVTVEYLLRDHGVEIRIPIDGLQEEDCHIYEIQVAPFFTAVQNDTGSYMMVPSGSGALIKAESSAKGEHLYFESVYGGDLIEPNYFQKRLQGQIHLPVFGSMNCDGNEATPDTAMLGIIEEGAECAIVNAHTGGMNNAYSSVYPSFRIRSKEVIVFNDSGQSKKSGSRYSNEVVNEEYLSVYYIPMTTEKGEDVTYNGMAARYRQYLQDRGYLKNTITNAPSLSVNMLGSTQMTKSFFGIPYQSDVGVTSLVKTKEIVSELKAMLGDKAMLVTLEGYGEGGLANTEIGGGFDISSEVGKRKDLDALVSYAAENGIILSMDYELAKFQESGSGISVGSGSAVCISSLKASVGSYQLNTGLLDEDGLSWYLVTRTKLTSLMDKTMQSVKKNGVGAISIGSLNRIVYSDFRDEGYAATSGVVDDVNSMLQKSHDNGVLVVADAANDYVVLNADYVTEVPMHSTRFNMFAEDIPFYAMVFQGYVPMTSASINLATDPTDAYLQAVATGMGLQFTLCDSLHDASLWDLDTAFVSSRYVDWKDRIGAMVDESAELYAKVGNQSIVRYEKQGDVSVTEFANGTIVYVNYAEEAVTYDGIQLEANSFIYR